MSIQETNLQVIANAIRQKDGTTGAIKASDFAERILAIPTGEGFAVPLTVTADSGALVTAANGNTTVTGTTGEDGTVDLILSEAGTWTVTAALNGVEKSVGVDVIQGYQAKFTLSTRLPDGYTEVEYIQSSGTQCINTGIKPSSYIKVVMDVEPTEAIPSSASANQPFFYSSYYNSYYYTYRMMWGSSGVGAAFGRVTSSQLFTVISADNAPRRMLLQLDGNTKTASVDGQEKTLSNSGGLAAANPAITLLATSANTTTGLSAKLYSVQIYNKEALVCNFVPCINEEGEAGLIDLVTNEFFANVGAGAFTPGPLV